MSIDYIILNVYNKTLVVYMQYIKYGDNFTQEHYIKIIAWNMHVLSFPVKTTKSQLHG